MNFFNELKRRHVFKVGAAYAIVAWLVVQVVNNLVPLLSVPDWSAKVVLIFLIAGFPVSLVLAWAFELAPQGVKRTVAAKAPSPPATASETPFATATSTPSIAVMPFANMSSDPEQEYFSDGLSEELLNKLARVKGLQVAGRTSSFHFKGKNEELRAVGQALAVGHILEGSVRKSGNRVRITAQLINAKSGYHLWTESYDRELADIFAVQDEIATAVTSALEVTLGVGAFGHVRGMTHNAAAFDEYLKGKAAYARSDHDSWIQATEHYQRAVALDPAFTLPLVYLWYIYSRGSSLVPEKTEEWRRKAADVLVRALAATPNSPYVQEIVATDSWQRGDWCAAGAAFDRLPALAAEFGTQSRVDLITGGFSMRVGRLKEAVAKLEAARAADPLLVGVSLYLATSYACSGDLDAALAEFDRGLTLDGYKSLMRMGGLLAALAKGDRAEIDRRIALFDGHETPEKNTGLAMAQFLDDAEAGLSEIRRLTDAGSNRREDVNSALFSYWAGYFGDPDLALSLMRDISVNDRAIILSFNLWHPLMREVRRLPGFKTFVSEMGLVDYWRKFAWADLCRPVGEDDFECS
jgi:TolB-like protein